MPQHKDHQGSSREKGFGKKKPTNKPTSRTGNAALQKTVAGCSVTIDTHRKKKNHPTQQKSSKRISNAGTKFPISSPLSCKEQNQQRSSSSRANTALARLWNPVPVGRAGDRRGQPSICVHTQQLWRVWDGLPPKNGSDNSPDSAQKHSRIPNTTSCLLGKLRSPRMSKSPGRKFGKLQRWWQGEHLQCHTGMLFQCPQGCGKSLGKCFLAHLQDTVELQTPPGLSQPCCPCGTSGHPSGGSHEAPAPALPLGKAKFNHTSLDFITRN